MKKLILFLTLIVLAVAFYLFDLPRFLTLDYLVSAQDQLLIWQARNTLLFSALYFAAYVLVVALSLPGAAIMTLAGGALFGLGKGLIIVSFASSIGATIAFLVARLLLKDWVQNRFGKNLKSFNKGFSQQGGYYLFTLRLLPVFPFWLVNLLMALTPVKTRIFYLVSQLGMLPGTFVYVLAGTQLAKVTSLSDIFSPSLIASFTLLGLFPLLAKKGIAMVQKKRVYANWSRPSSYDQNLVVIGAGAGGLVSAYIAASVKAKVTLIEGNKMGGDCLNYGCVPSKALIRSARFAKSVGHADQLGFENMQPKFSFNDVMARVHRVISEIEPHDSVERYTELGVNVVQGYARIRNPWTVDIEKVDGSKQTLTTRSIVIAAGARPFVPPLEGMAESGYLTSDTLWEALADRKNPPEKMVVLGGGPIGCELSQAFAQLGSRVIQIEMAPRVMLREDEEVSAFVEQQLASDGVEVLTDHKALRCEQRPDGRKIIVVSHNEQEVEIEYDELLCAVGRAPRLDGYGLENLGIKTERNLPTNEWLETLYPNIYAVGDVTGPYQFTHVASHQAWYAAVNALFGQFKRFRVDYRVIPWVTYVDPEVARVGINETEAKEQGIEYEVTRYNLDDLDRAIADSSRRGFIKVLTPPGKDKILGVTLVGSHAGELLSEFVLAMKHGLGLNKILGTIHSYPTWAEANKYAAGEWRRNHTPVKLLSWVEKYHTWRRR